MERELICIVCPLGCNITVKDDEVTLMGSAIAS